MDNVEERVWQIIEEQLGSVVDLYRLSSTRFKEDLACDSLDTIEVVMCLEEEFDIEIPDQDAEKLLTVGETVAYITEKIK